MPAAKDPADTAATETENTEIFTVAPGRSIVGDDGPVAAGGEILLTVKEGKRLQDLGFLLSDDGDVVVHTDGPPTVQGVEIKEVA